MNRFENRDWPQSGRGVIIGVGSTYRQTLAIWFVIPRDCFLPKELARKLEGKNVDFAVHPLEVTMAAAILNLLGNLAFPLMLLGSLLLRSSSVNTPGSPNLPFGLGRRDIGQGGLPGTGKTLLAKAIAGETGLPVFSLSGSELIEMFVGVGASRVRDLFNKMKANSPCLVFIDEIDAVGRQRGTGTRGGNDEREQTLNQLLTEMDGFSGNRLPKRDMKVFWLPNGPQNVLTGRYAVNHWIKDLLSSISLSRDLLQNLSLDMFTWDIHKLAEGEKKYQKYTVHSNDKKLDEDVSLSVIALRTLGFNGADLANLMNEADILAGRIGKDKITSKEIDDSIDWKVAGMEGTKMTDGKSKIWVACHEIRHSMVPYSATCRTLTLGHDPVQNVTLIPCGRARGLTGLMPGEDPALVSKKQLFARIVGGLGGRAAEEIIFGETEITTGAAGDLQQITPIARQIGPWVLTDPEVQSSDVVLRMLARNLMSEKLAEDIDTSVHTIIDSSYEIANWG
ncbi:FTSH protease 6 [Actinidia rufa]|uniref:FTSH protease 6 n=1 Tax=Actinidia rufa TaxID=165716 RepID=A0A7J0DKM5_9ERIC|nr:FTSH protease 6 [Actinidia rufa]